MNTHTTPGILVISRHAESEWNALGKWTGITDVNITDTGKEQSKAIGRLLKDMKFDVIYTSEQKRTHQTMEGILEGHAHHPQVEHHIRGAVNERDYGDLTGKNKWEVQEEIGEEAFTGIRRGWDFPVPNGETLKDVHGRVVPFFESEIVPQLHAGKHILLVAHGNSIRALMKHLEEIHEDNVHTLEMNFGEVLLYTFEQGVSKPVNKDILKADISK